MHLCGFTSTCWSQEEQKLFGYCHNLLRDLSKEISFMYLFDHYKQRHVDEFHELRQLGMIVDHYENRFFELKKYASLVEDEEMLVKCFIRGLNACTNGGVSTKNLGSCHIESQIRRVEFGQRLWWSNWMASYGSFPIRIKGLGTHNIFQDAFSTSKD